MINSMVSKPSGSLKIFFRSFGIMINSMVLKQGFHEVIGGFSFGIMINNMVLKPFVDARKPSRSF